MGITHVIRGVDHLTNAARQTQIYHGHGLGRADLRARAADPRARRRQAFEAPRRARRRGLPRHGLSAGRAAQLSRAARLEPRRRRDHLDRAGGRLVRHRRTSTRSPARFDFAKLEDLNGHYIRRRDDAGADRSAHRATSCPMAAGGARQLARALRRRSAGPSSLAAIAVASRSAPRRCSELRRRRRLSVRRAAAWRSTTRRPSCSTPRPAATLGALLPRSSRRSTDWQARVARGGGADLRREATGRSSARSLSHCAPRSRAERYRRRSSMSWPCSAATRRWRAFAIRRAESPIEPERPLSAFVPHATNRCVLRMRRLVAVRIWCT